MKAHKFLIDLVSCLLIVTFTETVMAECAWPSFDAVCTYFLDSGPDPACPGSVSTAGCMGKDCLGKNFGNEIMLVPGGEYASIWIARTDGEFFTPWYAIWPCDVSSNRGVSIVELPSYENHAGCVTGLVTEDHTYAEFFTNNTVTQCFGFVECTCD